MDVAPYSPIALAKARTVPDAIPGPAVGMTTVQKILLSLMPSVLPAAIRFTSTCSNAARAFRYISGNAITDEVNKMEINEGKNVSEVLAAVSEGSNEIGIVYATDAASVADKVDVIAEAPADALKTPVLYPVGLIEDKEASEDDTAAAEAFLEYIKSDDAMKVFEKYGFTAYKADDASETDDKDAEATETNAETETTEEAK